MLIRSFALPKALAEEAIEFVPEAVGANLNQMVNAALRDLVAKHKRKRFERDMARMACDPAMAKVTVQISSDFSSTESDGL